MRPRPESAWSALLHGVATQIGWLACVGGAARGLPWLGPAVVAVLLAVQLAISRDRAGDATRMLTIGAWGTVQDSMLSAAGLLTFAAAPASWLCPLWITALWLHFGASARPALGALARCPTAAVAVLGGVAGPLAYAVGARLGAAALHPALWPSVAALAVAWAVVLPLALGAEASPRGRSRRRLRMEGRATA